MENKKIKVGDTGYTVVRDMTACPGYEKIVVRVHVLRVSEQTYDAMIIEKGNGLGNEVTQRTHWFWKTKKEAQKHLKDDEVEENKPQQKEKGFKPYYYCYVYGKGMPKVRHPSYELAEAEAKRLTSAEGERVEICKVIAMTEIAPKIIKAEEK